MKSVTKRKPVQYLATLRNLYLRYKAGEETFTHEENLELRQEFEKLDLEKIMRIIDKAYAKNIQSMWAHTAQQYDNRQNDGAGNPRRSE